MCQLVAHNAGVGVRDPEDQTVGEQHDHELEPREGTQRPHRGND